MPIYDIHTHDSRRTDAIVNLPLLASVEGDGPFSAGIHPWEAHLADDEALNRLHEAAADARVVAIGETGFDTLHNPLSSDIDLQERLFVEHVKLSEEHNKPLIIHNLRATDRLIALRRRLRPTQTWIIHGFRGKPQLARQLIDHGFYLSIGEHFNPTSLREIPADRLLLESDTSPLTIADIASRANLPLTDFSPLFIP